jgi:two-component system, NarL family, response regulator LiaR
MTQETSSSFKLVVVDPDPLARSALADMLREDPKVVVAAQAANAVEAAELVAYYHPDVVLIEASMAAAGNFALLHAFKRSDADVGIVMLANAHDPDVVIEALRLGVAGIVTKSAAPACLLRALHVVHGGEVVLPPAPASTVVARLRQLPPAGRGYRPIRSPLTNREWEVLDMLMSGASTHDIAEELVLAEDTIYSHVKAIMRKLGAHTRAEAITAARRSYELTAVA